MPEYIILMGACSFIGWAVGYCFGYAEGSADGWARRSARDRARAYFKQLMLHAPQRG